MRKAVPRIPITEDLVEVMGMLLNELELRPDVRRKLEAAYQRQFNQQALLNDKLKAVLEILENLVESQVTEDESTASGVTSIGQPGLPMTGDVTVTAGTGVTFSQAGQNLEISTLPSDVESITNYELPVHGPEISISGTSYLAITEPVTVAAHDNSVSLRWYWESSAASGFALARLRNQTTGDTILEWSEASPFSRVLVELTDAAFVMPSAGDEVALEVCYSAAVDGEIEMTGPATWEVA